MGYTVMVSEYSAPETGADFTLDLNAHPPKDCIGCWSCWWTTPGRCVHHDLDEFYRAFLRADKMIIFARLSLDFVSGNLKTLFDRMIPHYLPYIGYKTGESMHLPRYEKYPCVEVYYEGDFSSDEAKATYENYIRRVCYQFRCECGAVAPVAQYCKQEAAV